MSALSKGDAPAEFTSTHPSDKTRIANLEKELPKVTPLYQDTLAKGKKTTSQKRKAAK
jgi:predicted Zn-dependent protease